MVGAPGGVGWGGHSLMFSIWGCATGQGMVFYLFDLNRVYNFMQTCAKYDFKLS